MESLTTYQQTAIQIASSGSKIATARQLADLRLAKTSDGRNAYPRYKDFDMKSRLSWLGDQFFGLAVLLHVSISVEAVSVDTVALDSEIMDNKVYRDLTLIEMQEAFRKGVNREYGDYYGLTSISMLGFIKGFMNSEKKREAVSIVCRQNMIDEQEATSRFFRELHGHIEVPEFTSFKLKDNAEKKNYTPEESAAHREKIRQQAEEIRKQYKANGNDKQEEA